ncbi:MAG: RNA-binding S4 domain-containing protein [Negativicutes bacterium]|nr:RNA-binding S4 domain-containing protein [Negativicutes bacterium]
MRLDKFLKVSRLIKRRTLAKEVADSQRIELNGRTVKPAAEVKVGDVITLHFGSRTTTVQVLSITAAPKKEDAAEMYKVLSETRQEVTFDW